MSSLEQQAFERKARLKALREKRERQQDQKGSSPGEPGQTESSKPQLKFRSYNPQTEDLREKKLPKAKPEEVEPQIKEQLKAAKDQDLGEVTSEVSFITDKKCTRERRQFYCLLRSFQNLANLAPRKVDWDLKRDIAKKLEKVDRRTQKAIVELIRDRLQEEDNDNLASAVATAGNEQQYDSD